MKKLVIFYSLEGNTKLIAKSIADSISADILELIPKKDISPTGFMRFVWGGKAAMMKESPELKSFDISPENYDLLILGTPVWAFTYSPPFNTFFKQFNIKNKKIAMFCCHGGGKGKVFSKLKNELPENEIIGEIDFKDPLKNDPDKSKKEAIAWAKKLVEQ
jgi:flavodoxin